MSARLNHANVNSSWPSRSSSLLSETVLATSTSTSVSSPLGDNKSWLTSSQSPHSHQHSQQQYGAATVGALSPATITETVPPLLGLQRLAGNAFALRQVFVPRASSNEVLQPPPPNHKLLSPRRKQQAVGTSNDNATPATESDKGKEKNEEEVMATGASYVTPNTSPRAGWPAWTPPPVSSATPRAVRGNNNNSQNQVSFEPLISQQQPQQPQQPKSIQNDSIHPEALSCSLPVSSRFQRRRKAQSARLAAQQAQQPVNGIGSFHMQGSDRELPYFALHSAPVQQATLPSASNTMFSPSLRLLQYGAQEMTSSFSCRQKQSQLFCSPVSFSDTARSCPDASTAAPLQVSSRYPPWRSVGQPPLSRQVTMEACASPFSFINNGTVDSVPHSSQQTHLPPSGSSVHEDRGRDDNTQVPISLSFSLPAKTPLTVTAVLNNLFQQYIDAQRALEPVLRQLQISTQKYLPLGLQEAVLEQVQQFAAQLESQAQQPSLSQTTAAPNLSFFAPPHLETSAFVQSRPGVLLEQEIKKADTPCRRDVLRRGEDIDWDAVLPYLAPLSVSGHATLRAVGPVVRRRIEQHAWSWLITEVRTAVCPFVIENGAEADVRDAYARLDGRERLYTGCVPVARRTPIPVPKRVVTQGERRLIDGTVLLDCERQSLLLDRAWREGWLHSRPSSHLRFLCPLLTHKSSLRFLRLNPLRIHLDNVLCDVLRPKRSQPNTGGSRSNCADGAAAGSGGDGTGSNVSGPATLEYISANTVPRAVLTPPPPPMLDGRPTTALSVTRKLLGDAVSAISRERARSTGVSTRTQLSHRLTSPSATAPQTLEDPLPSAPQLADLETRDCSKSTGVVNGAQHQQQQQRGTTSPPPLAVSLPHQHPYFRHESLPVLVEDLNGTAHIFCTRKTSMDGGAMLELLRGWLQHHHLLRRQPLYTTAAEFLLVGRHRRKKRRPLAVYGDVDYILCDNVPNVDVAGTAEHRVEEAPPTPAGEASVTQLATQDLSKAHASKGHDHIYDNTTASVGGDGSVGLRPLPMWEEGQVKWIGILRDNAALTPRRQAAERRFALSLQEWCSKRGDVLRRMNTVDPSWRMLGNAYGPQPRPLALHITEQHLPWLAAQLCPDSDGGAFADLEELHLCVAESLLPPGWISAWHWCLSVLRRRRNLLVVSIVAAATPPPMALGADTCENDEKRDSNPMPMCGSSDLSEPVTGPTSALFLEALLDVPALQVLDLHGITREAAMLLFQETTAEEVQESILSSFCEDGRRARLMRLRDLYVTVRRGHGAGANLCSIYAGEICVSSLVYPSLQVLWLDAPRLRCFSFDRFLVLRELHLVSDSALLCSALRGVEVLPYLEVLHVERAVIDDCSFLGDCCNLRELLLHACRLSLSFLFTSAEGDSNNNAGDAAVAELHGVERAPKLETLSLCYTEEIRQLNNFVQCRSLRRVLLTRCNGISNASIAGFEKLPLLELLALEYTRVSSLSHLAKAPSLRVLRVDGCKRVLRSSVMGLEMAPLLTELSLQDTNVSTVANFCGGGMVLQSLDLSGCRHLDVDGLQGIQALPQLEVLSLSHTPITDVNFLADCLRLTTLYVEGCTALLPTALDELRAAPLLRKIIATGCTSLTKIGQLGRCRSLEVLSVSGAAALTNAGVQGIEHSARLRFLDLSGTAVHSLCFLADGCRSLRYLSVRGCSQLVHVRELHGIEELPQLETFNMENLRVAGSLDFLTLSASLQYVSFKGCTELTETDVYCLQRSDINTTIP